MHSGVSMLPLFYDNYHKATLAHTGVLRHHENGHPNIVNEDPINGGGARQQIRLRVATFTSIWLPGRQCAARSSPHAEHQLAHTAPASHPRHSIIDTDATDGPEYIILRIIAANEEDEARLRASLPCPEWCVCVCVCVFEELHSFIYLFCETVMKSLLSVDGVTLFLLL
ncbi:hypothetical protein E2C01_088850 [Portunus trituberculatus]|uniref:Uncharacterized protein n=1 Tax=Portunus trituberculatus TaxID=210409 RepID=A0A5B7JAF7_PORTR|nr:hypothetical protein [Portunus trituberculatus]